MKVRNSLLLLAVALTAMSLMAAGQVAASVAVAPQPAFQGTHPMPPGSGGHFQGTHPMPPGSGGHFQGTHPMPPGSGGHFQGTHPMPPGSGGH